MQKMEGIIYCYHCIFSGKKYIGQTINEERRKTRHRYDCNEKINNKFYRAVRKYGWDNFIYGVIEICHVDNLNEQEVFYINKYDTYKNGYNSTVGGEGVRGFSPSDETRKKQSISAKNRIDDPHNKKYFTEEEKREAKRRRDREYQQKKSKEKNTEENRERRKIAAKVGGQRAYELGVGIHARPKQEIIEHAKKVAGLGGKVSGSQRWQCTVTGFVSNAGGLVRYQRARNIDTSNRIRIK